ncbi:hypothetical protein ACI2OX_03125 [Bacillus sp. N9]
MSPLEFKENKKAFLFSKVANKKAFLMRCKFNAKTCDIIASPLK